MSFRKLNILGGWISFILALVVYLLTLEPTVSLWDCGEFIASSYKLQVGHPPGAPLFLILGRVFSLFAPGPEHVARMINAVSAVASAGTIMFLFWTISHFLNKIFRADRTENEAEAGKPAGGSLLVVLGGALVGAMAYTFSDTFWFSAVEGEVYATSSLFTAVVFWAILKWENVADEPGANRWLVLIAYLVGLSIGVHLLNLLAIPAIVLVYYFRKYKPSRKGLLTALALSFAILLFVMYGIIPGIVKVATGFELFFTNLLGLHYNTGVVVYVALLLGALVFGIYRTQFVNKHVVWNTILVCTTVIIIGYSSYAMIVIRSLAAPPMNENRPENVFALLSYLNREQYGDRPLILGHQYNAKPIDIKYTDPVYVLDKKANKYEVAMRKPEYVMDRGKSLLPRMYSMDPNHIKVYEDFGTIKDRENPSFLDNIEFLLRYQIGHMYFRYFMWNFAGRQNDIQGHGEVLKGNWISGIGPIDGLRLGSQKNLPPRIANHPARNSYFFLPLLLGLLGLFYHADRNARDFWVVMSLFVLTGLAIVLYLNQTPLQPRERDYAYAGSFYAFSIWIGIGVAGLYQLMRSKLPSGLSALLAVLISFLAVPSLMAVQNWDDHDRSGRYTARDIARNYLESCEKNAVLFTVGDNDTFPLWYVQDVEGVREDVRIVNMMLFNMDWYIDQMRWQNYSSPPLKFSLPEESYSQKEMGSRIFVRKSKNKATADYVMRFIKSDDPRTKLSQQSGKKMNYVPTHKIILPVDSARLVGNGSIRPEDAGRMQKEIELKLPADNYLLKNALAQLDVISSEKWNRPIYYTAGGFDGSLGLEAYYRTEGLAFKLVPIHRPYSSILDMGDIDTDVLYDRLMNKFTWGRMNEKDVQLDYYTIRTLGVIRFRSLYTRLAMKLLEEGQKDKAIEVLDRCMELAPDRVLPFDQYFTGITLPEKNNQVRHYPGIPELYLMCGETEKASELIKAHYHNLVLEHNYYTSLKPRLQSSIKRELAETIYQIEEIRSMLLRFGQEELMLELGIASQEGRYQ